MNYSSDGIYFTKHHWVVNKKEDCSPIELQFEHPTSLISLNIEMTFNCKDINTLIDKFSLGISEDV